MLRSPVVGVSEIILITYGIDTHHVVVGTITHYDRLFRDFQSSKPKTSMLVNNTLDPNLMNEDRVSGMEIITSIFSTDSIIVELTKIIKLINLYLSNLKNLFFK